MTRRVHYAHLDQPWHSGGLPTCAEYEQDRADAKRRRQSPRDVKVTGYIPNVTCDACRDRIRKEVAAWTEPAKAAGTP